MSASHPVDAAIAAHQAAYAAATTSRTTLNDLHKAFDHDHDLEHPDEIRAALTTIHGPFAAEEIGRYFSTAASDAAAWKAEAEAWARMATIVPATPDEVRDWLAYVLAQAEEADEVVTLRRALAHVAGALVDRIG